MSEEEMEDIGTAHVADVTLSSQGFFVLRQQHCHSASRGAGCSVASRPGPTVLQTLVTLQLYGENK